MKNICISTCIISGFLLTACTSVPTGIETQEDLDAAFDQMIKINDDWRAERTIPTSDVPTSGTVAFSGPIWMHGSNGAYDNIYAMGTLKLDADFSAETIGGTAGGFVSVEDYNIVDFLGGELTVEAANFENIFGGVGYDTTIAGTLTGYTLFSGETADIVVDAEFGGAFARTEDDDLVVASGGEGTAHPTGSFIYYVQFESVAE